MPKSSWAKSKYGIASNASGPSRPLLDYDSYKAQRLIQAPIEQRQDELKAIEKRLITEYKI